MRDYEVSAGGYIQSVKIHLSEMVYGKVYVEKNDIIISTKELGEFHTTFDIWDKMLYGVSSKDTAEVIFKQYKKFVHNKLFKI